jgi:hypothetical protein
VREYLHSVQSHRQVESISEGSTVFTLGLGKRAPMGATYWQYREWGDSDKRHALFEPPQEHHATVKYLYFSAFPRSADPNCSSSAITGHISHEVIVLYTAPQKELQNSHDRSFDLRTKREIIKSNIPQVHRRPRLTTLRFASPSEPNALALTPFPPMAPAFLPSEEKALLTAGMLNRRIHPPFDFPRSCGRICAESGVSA